MGLGTGPGAGSRLPQGARSRSPQGVPSLLACRCGPPSSSRQRLSSEWEAGGGDGLCRRERGGGGGSLGTSPPIKSEIAYSIPPRRVVW